MDILELISLPDKHGEIVLKYKNKFIKLIQGEAQDIEPNIRLNFYKPFKNRGISLGFAIDNNVSLRRSLGPDKSGGHLWYSRDNRRISIQQDRNNSSQDSVCKRPQPTYYSRLRRR